MHATTPPEHLVSFGDGEPKYPALTSFFPAVAAATRDPVLQWFFTTYGAPQPQFPIWELLWYDDTLESRSPESSLPRGRAFAAHSGLISSRSNWDPVTTPSVVFSKAGSAKVNHTHPDAGQIEIHGHARPLIVDLGSVPYPDSDARRHYHFSSEGHNQINVAGRQQRWDLEHEAHCTHSAFDDELGGWWQIDLTDLHESVQNVRRTVVHLLPNIVVILDDVQSLRQEPIRLRWHPGGEPQIEFPHDFRVVVDEVALSAKVVELAGADSPELILGHHAYRPPYDHDRIGNPMPQRHEPYLDATVHGQKARFLSLFAIGEPRAPMDLWQQVDSFNWCIGQDDHQVDMQVASGVLSVTGPNGVWTMAID